MDVEPYVALIAANFPQLGLRSVVPILEGWDFLVLDINGEYIFRFPRRRQGTTQLEKEQRLLPALSAALPIPVPGYDLISPGEPLFAGYPKIQGQPLSRSLLASSQAVTGLASFLTALHSFPVEQARSLLGPGIRSVEDWRQKYLAVYSRVQTEVLSLLPAPAREQERRLWERFVEDERSFSFQTTLIHGDLAPEHILCDPASGSLSGVIDWGDASIGDPALDFTGLYLAGGLSFVERVLNEYTLPVGTELYSRVGFFAHIVPFYEVFFGLETGNGYHLQHGLLQINQPLLEMEKS